VDIDRPVSKDRSARDFCSWACYVRAVGRSLTRPCAACGVPITRQRSTAKRARWFCDKTCEGRYLARTRIGPANPAWRGGARRYYGAGWKPLRRGTRARASNTCARCGAPAADVHHLLPVRYFVSVSDAHFPSNVVALCGACHVAAHRAMEDVLPLFEFGAAAQVIVPADVRGARNGSAKLTERQVGDIRRRHAAGATGRALAREYGVNETAISAIVRRLTWRHLP
jgi:5-methylcytosine-specific restriction endonuclease McrA